jgi:hypothetical protein
VIDCLKGGHVCRLDLDGHPLSDTTFGVVGTITPLVDLWLEEGRLPNHMRPMPKVSLQLSCREDLERRSRSP